MILKKAFIIAEIGVNHNGDFIVAKEMIDKAKWAGANAVKFQTYNVNANYHLLNTSRERLQWAKNLALNEQEFVDLKNYADKNDILFLSTPFDNKSALFLNDLGVQSFKIASSGIVEIPLLNQISEFGKKVYLSTGMANKNDIKRAIHALEPCEIILLYCVSLYPAPFHTIDLNKINLLRTIFDLEVGYSDHSIGIEIPLAAIACNATVIEKHFKLDEYNCPDEEVSLCPKDFKYMVDSIRNIEKSFGNGSMEISDEEKKSRVSLRKGIYYRVDKKKNEIIFEDDLLLRKPSGEVGIDKFHEIVGKKLLSDVKADSEVKLKDFLD